MSASVFVLRNTDGVMFIVLVCVRVVGGKQDNMKALENQVSETQQVKNLGGDAPMFVSGGTVGNVQGENSVANKEEIDIDSEAPSVRLHSIAPWSIALCQFASSVA